MELTRAYTDGWRQQPDPVQWPQDRRPGGQEWVLIAAVWLLATWVPSGGWAATFAPGKTKARNDEQWPEPPAAAELAQLGDLAGVTGARILTSRVSPGPGQPFVPPRPDEQTAAERCSRSTWAVDPARQQTPAALSCRKWRPTGMTLGASSWCAPSTG